MPKVVGAALVVAAAFLSTPSVAQPQGAAQDQQKAVAESSPLDPNEIICQREEVTGSRLAKRRVCLTRSQWADRRLQDRQAIEKVQVERPLLGE